MVEELQSLAKAEPRLFSVLDADALARLSAVGVGPKFDEALARLVLRSKVWSVRRKAETLGKYTEADTERVLASFELPVDIAIECGLPAKEGQMWLDAVRELQRLAQDKKPIELWALVEKHPIAKYVPVQCQSCGHQVADVYPAPDDPDLVEELPTAQEKPLVRAGWFRGPRGPVVFVYNCPICGAASRWYRGSCPEVFLNPIRWGRLCGEQEDLKAWLAKYLGVRLRLCCPLDWDHVWAEVHDGAEWLPLDPDAVNFARRLHEGIGAWSGVLAFGTPFSGEARASRASADVTEAYLERAQGSIDEIDTWRAMIAAARCDPSGTKTQSRTLCGFILERARFDDVRTTQELRIAQEDFDRGCEWWEVASVRTRCNEGHVLESMVAQTARVCDLCSTLLSVGTDIFSCQPCDFDACALCYSRTAAEREQEKTQQMRRRLERYAAQAKMYAEEAKQEAARGVLPKTLLDLRAAEGPGETLLRELLTWFKAEFFHWTDKPRCPNCNGLASESRGMVEPTEDDLRFGASRVESWRCTACDVLARFPRYNDPVRLLESRNGRCGEWANCFTLCLATLGFDSRIAFDWTDHVWCEVNFGADERWIHCDPCENSLDSPLMYEAGWRKNLTYIVAFSDREVVDVTPRYTCRWAEVLTRRIQISEASLASTIAELDKQIRKGECPPPWRAKEEHELSARRSRSGAVADLTSAELGGRTSGSAEWRLERGELGIAMPISTTSSPTSFTFDARMEKASADASTTVVARLLGDAVLTTMDNVKCVNLTDHGAGIEVEDAAGNAPIEDSLNAIEGFTVEMWIYVDSSKLSMDDYRNPVVSRHGPASGWELRLCRGGGVVFLVTVDGVHHEFATSSAPQWKPKWTHVAATFSGTCVRVYIDGLVATEANVPNGTLSLFDGALLLGRNPAWRDRGARCWLQSARITQKELCPQSFMASVDEHQFVSDSGTV